MIEFLASFLGKLLGWALPGAWKAWITAFSRPKIKFKRAPENIVEHIGPGCTRERVREILGPPHEEVGDTWMFRFKDAIVQVQFYEAAGARSFALALTRHGAKKGFHLGWLGLKLGEVTFGDLMRMFKGGIRSRQTHLTTEVLFEFSLNRHSRWQKCTLGALSPLASGDLEDALIDGGQISSGLRVAAQNVRANWVGLSFASEELWFNWDIALPNA